jgi:catechol 2,3-dioxygenase-like lactoylglutathione lyase family enzyme
MFTTEGAFNGFSIIDADAAIEFYRDLLGLEVERNEMGFLDITLPSGARLLAYVKPDHEPASYTFLNFPVENVEAAVDELVAKGITMLRYSGSPQDDKGIMRGHGPDIAWFTDPSGNVIAVLAQ